MEGPGRRAPLLRISLEFVGLDKTGPVSWDCWMKRLRDRVDKAIAASPSLTLSFERSSGHCADFTAVRGASFATLVARTNRASAAVAMVA